MPHMPPSSYEAHSLRVRSGQACADRRLVATRIRQRRTSVAPTQMVGVGPTSPRLRRIKDRPVVQLPILYLFGGTPGGRSPCA